VAGVGNMTCKTQESPLLCAVCLMQGQRLDGASCLRALIGKRHCVRGGKQAEGSKGWARDGLMMDLGETRPCGCRYAWWVTCTTGEKGDV